MATLSKEAEKDNPLYFSGDAKDFPAFKTEVQKIADQKDCTFILEAGAALSDFYQSQLKDKTGSKQQRKDALGCEKNPKQEGNHVPTDVSAYKDDAMDVWFGNDVYEGIKTETQLALNKNRFQTLGSNWTDHKKLGYATEELLEKAHKQVDLKYLKVVNRMAVRLLHGGRLADPVASEARKDQKRRPRNESRRSFQAAV